MHACRDVSRCDILFWDRVQLGPINLENYQHFGEIGKNCKIFKWRTNLLFKFFIAILKIHFFFSLWGLKVVIALENCFWDNLLRSQCWCNWEFFNVKYIICGKTHHFLSIGMGSIFGPNVRGVTALTCTCIWSVLKVRSHLPVVKKYV